MAAPNPWRLLPSDFDMAMVCLVRCIVHRSITALCISLRADQIRAEAIKRFRAAWVVVGHLVESAVGCFEVGNFKKKRKKGKCRTKRAPHIYTYVMLIPKQERYCLREECRLNFRLSKHRYASNRNNEHSEAVAPCGRQVVFACPPLGTWFIGSIDDKRIDVGYKVPKGQCCRNIVITAQQLNTHGETLTW